MGLKGTLIIKTKLKEEESLKKVEKRKEAQKVKVFPPQISLTQRNLPLFVT